MSCTIVALNWVCGSRPRMAAQAWVLSGQVCFTEEPNLDGKSALNPFITGQDITLTDVNFSMIPLRIRGGVVLRSARLGR